jgi:hypothetical protein
MERKALDKLLTSIGAVLTVFLFAAAGLLQWGHSFAASTVTTQLQAQNIFFPAAGAPGFTADEFPDLQKWGGQQVTTGEQARGYADKYIWVHMKAAAKAVTGKEATYSEVSGQYMAMTKDPTADPTKVAAYGNLRQTLFMGNTLRGLLLNAFAFWQLGTIALYAAIAAAAAGVVMLVLTVLGMGHIKRLNNA